MDYYEKEYKAYFTKTVNIDPALFLEKFIQKIPLRANVWDIGCGSGRDLRWLKERGFHAVGLERSHGLATLARQYSGCEVVEADFETFDFSGVNADGMLMTGALVHLHWDRLETVLHHIIKGVKSQGIVYISLKKGDKKICIKDKLIKSPLTNRELYSSSISGVNTIEAAYPKRDFYMWQPHLLQKIFNSEDLEVLHFAENLSMMKTHEVWLGYLLKKRR